MSCDAAWLQMALYESILASPYRTLNGEEADFFFVPVLDSCIITRADDAPHLSMQVHFRQLFHTCDLDSLFWSLCVYIPVFVHVYGALADLLIQASVSYWHCPIPSFFYFFFIGNRNIIEWKVHRIHDDEHIVIETITSNQKEVLIDSRKSEMEIHHI